METRYASDATTDVETPAAGGAGAGRDAPDEALRRIRARVSDALGSVRYDRYFGVQTVMRVDGTRLDVTVPSRFLAELIDRRFGQVLRTAVREVLAPGADGEGPKESTLNFRVSSSAFGRAAPAPGAPTSPSARVPPPPARRATSLIQPSPGRSAGGERFSLDAFIVGTSNRLAHAGALRVADEEGPAGLQRLFLQGVCGVGKTHLLRGIAARFKCRRPHARVRYATGEEFTNEFVAALRANALDAFRRSYRKVDLLCLDDAHFLSGKDKTQTELLHTFDAIDIEGARIVIASDEHPRDIRELSEQLASRFLAAGVVRIDAPEPELRVRIAAAAAARRGLRFDEAALRLLAERAGGREGSRPSVRDLEGALTQVEALVRTTAVPGQPMSPGPITVGTVRRALRLDDRDAPARSSRPVPFTLIISEVCRELGVAPEDFAGRGRHKRVVLARSLCAFLGRSLTALSYPEMARQMSRPTHSTLIMAFARVRDRLDDGKDPGLREELGPEGETLTLRDLCERLRGVIVRAADRAPNGPERGGPSAAIGR